ncbi:MAG: hypothetical protein RI973_856 [Bacteroidota bacterium]|jgi:homoserine dehydrogenase
MANADTLSVGLFGFGVVGEAVFRVIQQTPSLAARIVKICIKNPGKPRSIDASFFTTNREEILGNEEVNVVIEAIDDADASFEMVSRSLAQGKSVITANKKMLARHLPELIALSRKTGASLLYEASCCASIPVIRNLEEYYDNDLLVGLRGIINGSTNYILTQIFERGLGYAEALRQAQEKGFAESNPSLDVSGQDAVNKFCILLTHAYGILAQPEELPFTGIENIHPIDREVALAERSQIKLVANAIKLPDGQVAAYVLPSFVKPMELLSRVHEEYNGVVITSALTDEQFFYGKGAGGFPTASAILSDLSALRYRYKYEYKKLMMQKPSNLCLDVELDAYVSLNREEKLPAGFFEETYEYFTGRGFHYRKGRILLSKLMEDHWWKQDGVSLILM